MESLTGLLGFFGVTPDKYPFAVLAALIVGIGYVQNGNFERIGASMNKIKTNVKVIATFLATQWPGSFDASLIEAMSPLQIKPAGFEVLAQSGFGAIMEDPNYRQKILAGISCQDPATRLDVEQDSIVYFRALLEEKFMQPIKTYLYNFPAHRDTFPTLAGLRIRDEYLKDHPEITQ